MNKTKKTLREQKFIEAYINNGGNATEAFLAVNKKVNKDTAGVLGLRMLRNVKVEVEKILNQIGLNDVYLANKLKEGLETRNLSIRVRYLDMIFKLKNIYPADRSKLELTGKDGKPIGGPTITLIEKSYVCPLREKGECPVEEKIKELEKSKKGELKSVKQ
ncbi:MAG: terminase small subunit [Chloroflexota bacterium]|nr:terminase small subunit [Chloroflexota bacterium]